MRPVLRMEACARWLLLHRDYGTTILHYCNLLYLWASLRNPWGITTTLWPCLCFVDFPSWHVLTALAVEPTGHQSMKLAPLLIHPHFPQLAICPLGCLASASPCITPSNSMKWRGCHATKRNGGNMRLASTAPLQLHQGPAAHRKPCDVKGFCRAYLRCKAPRQERCQRSEVNNGYWWLVKFFILLEYW